MARVLGVGTATVGLAAAEEALVEGAGAEFADGGELGVDLVEAELQGSGIEGGWHGAPFFQFMILKDNPAQRAYSIKAIASLPVRYQNHVAHPRLSVK